MTKQHIHIGIEDENKGLGRFVDAWHKAEKPGVSQPEVHLNFEDLSMLLSVLSPKRIELLKSLRQKGPMSVRGLAKEVCRDYKNVHTDVNTLENVGLIERTEDDMLAAPWDVIDAHVQLVA